MRPFLSVTHDRQGLRIRQSAVYERLATEMFHVLGSDLTQLQLTGIPDDDMLRPHTERQRRFLGGRNRMRGNVRDQFAAREVDRYSGWTGAENSGR